MWGRKGIRRNSRGREGGAGAGCELGDAGDQELGDAGDQRGFAGCEGPRVRRALARCCLRVSSGSAFAFRKLREMNGRLGVSFEQCFIICLVFSIQKNPVFSFYSDSKKKMISEYFGLLSSLMQSVYKSLY